MAVNIEMRRDLAANWTLANPILSDGEWGKETDTNKWKNGDGVTAWNALAYTIPSPGTSAQPTSAQFSAVSAHVELVSAAVNVVSNALSVETAARVAAVNTVSNAASNALSVANAASNAASIVAAAVNVVSNALSGEIVNRVAGDNAVSAQAASAINVVSAQLVSVSAVLETHIVAASAAATSADAHANTASAAATSVLNFVQNVSAMSVGGISTKGLQSVINALSNRISAGGGTGSVTSAEVASLVQIASAAATSADAHANTVSARVVSVSAELASLVQIASAAATSADAHANAASAAATSADAHANTVSARVVSVSAELASLVQIASAAATSADAHANTVSARVVSVSAELASLVQIASAAATSADGHANTASAAATSVLNFVQGVSVKSVGGTSVKGLQSVVNALSNRISATAAGTASATSVELASVDARVNSVNTFLSGISARTTADVSIHGVQSVINALSSRIGREEIKVITASFQGSTNTAIQGLSLSVAALGIYEIHAMFVISATTSQPYFMRWSAPAMTNAAGFWRAAMSVTTGGSIAQVTAQFVLAAFNELQNGIAAFTANRGGTFQTMPVTFDGVFVVGAVGGGFAFKCGTVTGQTFAAQAGSFSRSKKLA